MALKSGKNFVGTNVMWQLVLDGWKC